MLKKKIYASKSSACAKGQQNKVYENCWVAMLRPPTSSESNDPTVWLSFVHANICMFICMYLNLCVLGECGHGTHLFSAFLLVWNWCKRIEEKRCEMSVIWTIWWMVIYHEMAKWAFFFSTLRFCYGALFKFFFQNLHSLLALKHIFM